MAASDGNGRRCVTRILRAKPASVGAEPASKIERLGGAFDLTNSIFPGPSQGAARRLIGARYSPAEPPRPRSADIDKMVSQLPYGQWTCADGRVVIFNRRYTPIWQRLPDGRIERANPHEWIKWTRQSWFDLGSARYERDARERLRKVLQDFFDGKISPYKEYVS